MVRPVEALDGDGDEDEDEYGDEDVDEDGDDQGSTRAGFFSICLGICEAARARRRPPPGKYVFVLCPGTGGIIPSCRPEMGPVGLPPERLGIWHAFASSEILLYFVRVRGALVPGARTVYFWETEHRPDEK